MSAPQVNELAFFACAAGMIAGYGIVTYPGFTFWAWLCRFAFRRARISPRVPVGLPGHRDPDFPCEYYWPSRRRSPGPNFIGLDLVLSRSSCRPCRGDGHYLCSECEWYEGEE